MTPRPSLAPAPAHDPAALARAILSDGRFHLAPAAAHPRPKSPLDLLFDWLRGLYERLMDAIHLHVHVTVTGSAIAGDLVLVALAVVLLIVFIRLLREFVPASHRITGGSLALADAPGAPFLYERSCEAAARKDFPQAVALLFAATVDGLDLRGVVRAGASVTVGEFREELRNRDASLVPLFDAIARPFSAAAYADAPVGEAEWTAARDAFLHVLDASVRRAA